MGKYRLHCSLDWFYSIKQRWQYMWLCYKSLTYNIIDSTAESAFEPLFCCVDFTVRWFGVAFVAVVVCLIASVVVIFYMCIMPLVLEGYSTLYAYLHLFYGHYLLMMISFHYLKAVTTNPGKPPSVIVGVPVTCICKRCFFPKPPRTHHCSVCKSCRLKMDHHCPWLNNCVGHFNQRYFISFCTFMCLGTIYVSLSSWSVFKDCFHAVEKYQDARENVYSLAGWQDENYTKVRYSSDINLCSGKSRSYNNSVVYLWILCSAVTAALGCLTWWHAFLISRGETSIEKLINKKQRQRMQKKKQKYKNPYDYGVLENWRQLLGFRNFKSFIRRVLLPSVHLPDGDGVTWEFNHQAMFVA